MGHDQFLAFLEKIGIALAAPGAAGGLVRWITLREHPVVGMAAVLVGAIMSFYFSEPLAPVMLAVVNAGIRALEPLIGPVVLTVEDFKGPSGFLIGLGGIVFAGIGIDFWRSVRGKLGGHNGKTDA